MLGISVALQQILVTALKLDLLNVFNNGRSQNNKRILSRLRWPTSITANSLSHGKNLFVIAKLSFPRQNFLSHGNTFFSTAKTFFSTAKNFLFHGKKLSFPRQNFLFYGETLSHSKTFFFAAKLSFSWLDFYLYSMTLPKQDVNSFITHEGTQQCLPELGLFWKLLVCLP